MSVSSRTRSKIKQREEEEIEAGSLLLKLPGEIHDEIFLKLPAESILTSRCVCKLLNDLLSCPNFIKNHVNRTNQTKRNPKILNFQYLGEDNPLMIRSIPIDYASISSSVASPDRAVLINYPFESDDSYCHIFLGSCNGLVCLRIYCYEEERREFLYYRILNPLTGEYKDFIGPPSHGSKPMDPAYKVAYGFGYDSNLDDYKLVIISDFEKPGCFKIDVYTVKLDSWSRIQGDVDYLFRFGGERSGRFYGGERSSFRTGVFFNGSLHWLGFLGSEANQVIICFDVSNETLVGMPLPENIVPPSNMYTNVRVWGDCICIVCFRGSARTDVWVMQEYGVKESWTKKYIPQKGKGRFYLENWQPLWYFHNKEILVCNFRQELFLYDITNKTVRRVVLRDIIMDHTHEIYVESIATLDSGTYLEKQITHGIMENMSNDNG